MMLAIEVMTRARRSEFDDDALDLECLHHCFPREVETKLADVRFGKRESDMA